MRILAAIAIIAIIASAAYASAAGLNVNGGAIQSGAATDLTCQPESHPVKVEWQGRWSEGLNAIATDSAVVRNIHPLCSGKQMMLVVRTAGGMAYPQPAQTIGAIEHGTWGAVTFNFGPIVAKEVVSVDVSIIGQ
jgi:hypothetical protein